MRATEQTKYIVQCIREGASMYEEDARAFLAEHDAYVRAEVLTEVTTWLVKKAREFRAEGQRVQADTASLLASKVERGAVRPDNLRMLPADFFEPGHTYTGSDFPEYDWKFRCDDVTTHPENGERAAIGWRFFNGVWDVCTYGADDWDIHQHVGLTDVTEGGDR